MDFGDIQWAEKIGGGSYGTVYKAKVKKLNRAVKILKLGDSLSYKEKYTLKMGFFEEIKRLCKVNSNKTIKLQGISINKHPCIIMNLIEG